jgi:hypothetical protein
MCVGEAILPQMRLNAAIVATPTYPFTLYRWRRRGGNDPWATKGWKLISWRMTEASAAKFAQERGCEIQKIPGSEMVIDGPYKMPGNANRSPNFEHDREDDA